MTIHTTEARIKGIILSVEDRTREPHFSYIYYFTLTIPCWVRSSCNAMLMVIVERRTNKMELATLPTVLSPMRDGGNSCKSYRLRSSTARSFVVINRGLVLFEL